MKKVLLCALIALLLICAVSCGSSTTGIPDETPESGETESAATVSPETAVSSSAETAASSETPVEPTETPYDGKVTVRTEGKEVNVALYMPDSAGLRVSLLIVPEEYAGTYKDHPENVIAVEQTTLDEDGKAKVAMLLQSDGQKGILVVTTPNECEKKEVN